MYFAVTDDRMRIRRDARERLVLTGVFVLAVACLLLASVTSAWADLAPRYVPAKPDHSQLWPGLREDLLIVKFREGSEVRLRAGRLVSQTGDDLTASNALLVGRSELELARLFSRPEEDLASDRTRAQQRSGREMADLDNYYRITLREPSQAAAERLLDRLNALDIVEIAYAEPIPQLALLLDDNDEATPVVRRLPDRAGPNGAGPNGPGSPSATASISVLDRADDNRLTPNFVDLQGYLDPAPTGVGAGAAWFYGGGRGESVKIIDIETGWNWAHEDMKVPFFVGGSTGYSDHGIAVVGEMCAVDNGYGVTGIANGVEVGSFGVWGTPTADAFNQVVAELDEGDIFVIELHCPGPRANGSGQYGYIALEWWQANYDAIATGTANGIICCQAAGNGEQDFDNFIYEGRFDRNLRDSGAIIVGASNGASLQPAWFTNYGTRVDLHGWGANVVTTGYGNLYGDFANEYYTDTFGGTSSATPIVTGTVACMQGIYKAQSGGVPLSGSTIAAILRQTGTPQQGSDLIGPRPDLLNAIPLMLNDLASVSGVITDADTGLPLAGAAMRIVETGSRSVAGGDGSYTIVTVPGTWTLRTEHFGYMTLDSEVIVAAGAAVTHDVALAPLPLLTISGEVHRPTGAPISGAEVILAGTSLPPVITAEDGSYTIADVPSVGAGLVIATAPGLTPDVREVMLSGFPATVDLRLAVGDNFETGGGGFSGTGDWEWGSPIYDGGPNAHSGSSCWATDLTGTYSDGTSRLTSPAYDLTDADEPRLTFWHWYSIWGPYDGINVKISVDGSATWQVIEPVGGYPDPCIYVLDGQPCEAGWTNSSDGWVPGVFDLSSYVGHSVRFRFIVAAWYAGTAGWYLDDLAVHSAAQSTAVLPATRISTYLKAPWPTPTGGPVTVAWGLAQPSQVTLEVYNLAGRKVRTLVQESLPAGSHSFLWDGRDADGRRASQGIYLVRMRFAGAGGANGALAQKVVLLR